MGGITLTVYFDGRFWTGLAEDFDGCVIRAGRIVFGAEPADCELYAFVLSRFGELNFSAEAESGEPSGPVSFKRARKLARRALESKPGATASRQAISREYEKMKTVRRADARRRKEAEDDRRFLLKSLKRKRKHRGH